MCLQHFDLLHIALDGKLKFLDYEYMNFILFMRQNNYSILNWEREMVDNFSGQRAVVIFSSYQREEIRDNKKILYIHTMFLAYIYQ